MDDCLNKTRIEITFPKFYISMFVCATFHEINIVSEEDSVLLVVLLHSGGSEIFFAGRLWVEKMPPDPGSDKKTSFKDFGRRWYLFYHSNFAPD